MLILRTKRSKGHCSLHSRQHKSRQDGYIPRAFSEVHNAQHREEIRNGCSSPCLFGCPNLGKTAL